MKSLKRSNFHEAFYNIPRTLRPDDTAANLVGYFVRNPDFNIAIIEGNNGEILGVVNKDTLLKSIFEHIDPDSPLEKFINPNYRSFSVKNADFDTLIKQIEDTPEGVVIEDEEGSYQTVVSCLELLKVLKKESDIREKKYAELLGSAYEGIIVIDVDGKIVIFNNAATKMLNKEAEKVIGFHVKEIIPNIRLLDVLSSGKQEVHQRHRIGEATFLTHKTPIYLEGKMIGAMAQFQEISDIEDSLTQLADMNEFLTMLELILDNAYVGIIFCDAKGIIRFMNRMYEELLEIPRDQVYGKHITEYFPDSRLPGVIKTGKPEYGWKYNFMGKRTLIVNRIPVKKKDQVIGVIAQCIFKDISEIKKMAKKLDLLETKVRAYERELSNILTPQFNFNDIIGTSEAILSTKKLALSYAATGLPVLIIGDTGTGKELFAHSIHAASERSEGPFVCLNCASMPENLVESELFGYEPGAFTGASSKGKIGKVELANGGTLFLDEICDMPLEAQAKLLRVVEGKRVERIGSVKPIEVDFRLISATNKDPLSLINKNKFREDLYYRIGTLTLIIPCLGKRTEDIPILVDHFVRQDNDQGITVSHNALRALMTYNWPGNIRQLKNVIEHALVVVEDGKSIDTSKLPAYITNNSSGPAQEIEVSMKPLNHIVREGEETAICNALKYCNGNKSRAAKLLGISRSVFYYKLKRYGLLDN